MKKAVAAIVAIPILWLAYNVYSLSVRYGTSNPCDMIAERLTAETFKFFDPLDNDLFLRRERPSALARKKEDIREHGAWACWKSVLFDVSTTSEIIHANVMEANSLVRGWESDSEEWRSVAVASTWYATVDVLEVLISAMAGL